MTDENQWRFSKEINLPSLMSVGGVALTGLYLFSQLQFQVNQNTAELNAWKLTWAQFTSARELTVRNYEQRMTTQEAVGKEIMRRLDSIDDNLQRLQPVIVDPPRR